VVIICYRSVINPALAVSAFLEFMRGEREVSSPTVPVPPLPHRSICESPVSKPAEWTCRRPHYLLHKASPAHGQLDATTFAECNTDSPLVVFNHIHKVPASRIAGCLAHSLSPPVRINLNFRVEEIDGRSLPVTMLG
jgi:hypothetical protein